MKATELSSILDKLHEVKTDSVLADEHADKAEAESHVIRDGKTRSTLTLTFMRGFFGLLVFSCLFVLIYNWAAVHWIVELKKAGLTEDASKLNLLELDKILSIVIGALGTSLGFIIGYYFKEKHA
ncbi:TPA: hypothetical protein ACPYUI_002822 [Raoultella ornithinolytica]|uniref:hypothetical protein n=1 Tax=Klebsiella pneumoniae complex TaxID=3390273 RepID=UPI0027F0CC9F|nr:hypothetical protein [Klebsiella aerogenes]MDZ9811934.1 hypothetical protein [Escherichia coli]MEA4205205.1 hypothetical protein [Klebsiella pneumoniae]HDU4730603.1 hypothetical protein [Klebsiella quasipneumoniae subsp. similipneumoniae]HBR1342187.1 hypothetical protein [Klebsiella pneumoniae]